MKKDAVAIIERGHPWLFREQMSSAAHVFEDGDWVRLVDGTNKVIGYGIFEAEGAIAIRVLLRGGSRPPRRACGSSTSCPPRSRSAPGSPPARTHSASSTARAMGSPRSSSIGLPTPSSSRATRVVSTALARYVANVLAAAARGTTGARHPAAGRRGRCRDHPADRDPARSRGARRRDDRADRGDPPERDHARPDAVAGAESRRAPRVPRRRDQRDPPPCPPPPGAHRYRSACCAGTAPATVEFHEDGRALYVDLEGGHKTGTYLDLRALRRMLADAPLAKAQVLNLFAYSGMLGRAAELAGATSITQVDQSARALQFAAAHHVGDPGKHQFVVADVFDWLPAAPRRPSSTSS